MTQNTDQDRAEFEAVASDYGACPKAIERDAKGNYLLMHTATGWMWWQAARRAPAAPVPQGVREAAQRAHDWMESQADSQSKGNFHSFDLLCLRQERDALAEALAASQPNGEAA